MPRPIAEQIQHKKAPIWDIFDKKYFFACEKSSQLPVYAQNPLANSSFFLYRGLTISV